MFETILEVYDADKARVLIAALAAHGFHPAELGNAGFPGVFDSEGIPINVPESEARDARLLAEALLRDMAD
mgnify:CR=1 FL=1